MARAKKNVNVYGLLKERIQFLEMKPGGRIIESELSEEFGVSRTPIREALKRLEEEQFIDIYPQYGTFVSKIDIKLVKETAYMRHVLESDVLGQLCDNKYEVSSFVEKNLMMMQLALKNHDYKGYIKQDNDFHRNLFKCAGHEIVWETITGFLAHYTRVLVLDMMLPDNLEASFESHKEIVESIERGDKDRLHAVMSVHHDEQQTEADEMIRKDNPDYFV